MNQQVKDGIGVIVFAGIMFYGATLINLSGWDQRSVSPRFFPFFLSFLTGILGFILILTSKKYNEKKEKREKKEKLVISVFNKKLCLPAPIFLISVTILYLIIIKRMGFIISSIIYIFILLFTLQPQKLKLSIILSFLITICIYIVFYYGFKVALPIGVLDF